jgi:hypothetical protein
MKKKANRSDTVIAVLWLLTGISLGLVIMFTGDMERLFDKGVGSFLIMYGLYILLAVVAGGLQMVIHEGGHLVFGLLSGYRMVSFRGGRWMIARTEGKNVLRKQSVAGTGGQCVMTPPPYDNGNFPYKLYNAGGVLMNLITVPVFVLLFIGTRRLPVLPTLFAESAVFGLSFALVNGIPMQTKEIANDGYNMLHLGDSLSARRSFWTSLKATEVLLNGARVKDVPEEFFFLPSDEELKDPLSCSAAAVMEVKMLDEHRCEEANALCVHLLEGGFNLAGIHRNQLLCDRITTDLLLQNGRTTPESLSDEEMVPLLKKPTRSPTAMRTRYLVSLLVDRDPAAAEKVRAEFEKIAASYPSKGEMEGERELMHLADEVFAALA